MSCSLVVETIHVDRLVQTGPLWTAVELFRDVTERALELDDDELVRTSKTHLAELHFKLGRVSVAKEELAQVAAEA